MTNELPVWRAKRGRISQRDLAKVADIQPDRYWRIENDHVDPTADERAALARVLETTEGALFPELAAAASPSEGEVAR
jgi:transcriptional regulator with XRE-family HTH domain